jgi:DeoR family fructose operon transcriptional repressor
VLRADVAFVGTNGLSAAHGLSTPDHDEAAAKRAMVGAAHQVVVLVDSSKIGQEHMVRFAEVGDIDVVVTDAGITNADRAALERFDVEVVIA